MALIKALKALADERRLEILRKLLNSDLCVGALARHLGVSKPAVSQHLQILRKAGLVLGEKRGYWTHYMVDRHALSRLAAELNRLAAEAPPCTAGCRRNPDLFDLGCRCVPVQHQCHDRRCHIQVVAQL